MLGFGQYLRQEPSDLARRIKPPDAHTGGSDVPIASDRDCRLAIERRAQTPRVPSDRTAVPPSRQRRVAPKALPSNPAVMRNLDNAAL
jgi:hypothetical protein